MKSAIEGYTLFPDYMWAQLAVSWGIVIDKNNIDPVTLELAKIHFNASEQKHSLIANYMQDNYQWHKENVFNGLDCNTWFNNHSQGK
jgi:hypothetical protein